MNFWATDGQGQLSLSEKEKALRNEFVRQYLIDYDELAACMRLGFIGQYAQEYSVSLMQEPYVRAKITEMTLASPDDDTAQEEADKQLTLAVLREAAQRGPYSSRVAAAAKLAAILGMDKPVTSSLELHHKGGVMMVPGIGNIDDWESEALKSQQSLVDVSLDQ